MKREHTARSTSDGSPQRRKRVECRPGPEVLHWQCRAVAPSISRQSGNHPTHLQHDTVHLFVIPWSTTSPHLENNTADTPDIDLRGISLLTSLDDLWCHPDYCTLHGSECLCVVFIHLLRYAEAGDFANPGILQKDVAGLEILDATGQKEKTDSRREGVLDE
jgi:hypothetical protein